MFESLILLLIQGLLSYLHDTVTHMHCLFALGDVSRHQVLGDYLQLFHFDLMLIKLEVLNIDQVTKYKEMAGTQQVLEILINLKDADNAKRNLAESLLKQLRTEQPQALFVNLHQIIS